MFPIEKRSGNFDIMEALANTMLTIILQYTSVSN